MYLEIILSQHGWEDKENSIQYAPLDVERGMTCNADECMYEKTETTRSLFMLFL